MVLCFRARPRTASSMMLLTADWIFGLLARQFIPSYSFTRMRGGGTKITYLVIVNKHHHDGIGGHLLHGIEISKRIHGDQAAIFPLARAVSPRAKLAHVRELLHPVSSPGAHKIIFLILGTDAFLPRVLPTRGFVAAQQGRRLTVGEGMQCLAEALFSGQVEGAGIGNHPLGASVGSEMGGAGDVIKCRRH